ncbi:hypothetical protein EV702DRAFT_966447, partial [Suillus placidus]
MKSNPEFGEAVHRLRLRQCTFEDVDLFNSQLIRSANNPDCVDLGDGTNQSAAAIVATNVLQEVLNTKKAEASCAPEALVRANALDKCSHETLDFEDRLQLLKMDFSSVKASRSLPGVIPLYVGMPVIMRVRNISTDLGITNGSQGVIHYISTAVCPVGLMYARCVIVEFPGSKVHLSDLPGSCFPVVPVSWTFTTLLKCRDGSERKLRVTRHQLPIQPAFAVTGHSAQGKTLPRVLVN